MNSKPSAMTVPKRSHSPPKLATIMRFQVDQAAMKLGIQAVLLIAAACWQSQAFAQDQQAITHGDLWLTLMWLPTSSA
jgi:hypothetical protein